MEEEKNNISQELLETIESYFNNSMENNERILFEEKLINNLEFKEQVEDIKTMLLGIETQALKEQLDTFHSHFYSNKKKHSQKRIIRHIPYMKLSIAAVFVIAIGCFWLFNTSHNKKLYSKYFKPDPGLQTSMGTDANFEFYDAMIDYKRGDYNKAIKKWEILSTKKPNNDTINYFLGLAYMCDKNVNDAIPFLERAVNAGISSVFFN